MQCSQFVASLVRRALGASRVLALILGASSLAAETHFLQSGQPPQLVELFTSQGCSSCPSADAFVNRLLRDDGLWSEVVPVVFHVDYWDYLGWEDLYSEARYSQRQRNYRASGRVASVYTPGFVVDAEEWRGFFRAASLPKRRRSDRGGELEVKRMAGDAQRFQVRYESLGEAPVQHYAHLALLGFGIRTPIERGENRGRKLPYEFTVLAFQTQPLHSADAQTWQGELTWEDADAKRTAPRYGLAAWVTTKDNPTPVQVLGGWLDKDQDPYTAIDSGAEGL